MGKNVNAINKIIKELSLRDYKARCAKLTKSQKHNISIGKKTLSDYGGYSFAADTMEAIDTKHNYQNEKITEAEYKIFCLRYNLITLWNYCLIYLYYFLIYVIVFEML